jgi:ribosomal protein S27E
MTSLKCEKCGRLLAEFEALPDGKYRTVSHQLAVSMPIYAKPGEAYAQCPDCRHSTRFDSRYLARSYPKDED